ncbi:MAG: hypothetical protein C4528_03730 [Gammaproteobacteria bacterium]|nr:MAG: hypothetical protein C4528_03730 [Gammaproteobacteria bacterium]
MYKVKLTTALLFSACALTTSALMADTESDEFIKSFRQVWFESGRVYVGASEMENCLAECENQEHLYDEPWYRVSVDEIAFVKGARKGHYVLIPSQVGANNSWNWGHAVSASVSGAALFVWNCDDSLIPMLDLGDWKAGGEPQDFISVAIEVDEKYGLPSVRDVPKGNIEKLPADVKRLITAAGALRAGLASLDKLLVWERSGRKALLTLGWDENGQSETPVLIIYPQGGHDPAVMRAQSFAGLC